ncbi:MAG: hypothetical protein OEW75_09555, partial [Cyclobacteriaceae bacterium]|nr:hypothetical protein [Cyclobacteriaceae bacterium]
QDRMDIRTNARRIKSQFSFSILISIWIFSACKIRKSFDQRTPLHGYRTGWHPDQRLYTISVLILYLNLNLDFQGVQN